MKIFLIVFFFCFQISLIFNSLKIHVSWESFKCLAFLSSLLSHFARVVSNWLESQQISSRHHFIFFLLFWVRFSFLRTRSIIQLIQYLMLFCFFESQFTKNALNMLFNVSVLCAARIIISSLTIILRFAIIVNLIDLPTVFVLKLWIAHVEANFLLLFWLKGNICLFICIFWNFMQ